MEFISFTTFIATVATALLIPLVTTTWKISKTMSKIEDRLASAQRWMNKHESNIEEIPLLKQRVTTLEGNK